MSSTHATLLTITVAIVAIMTPLMAATLYRIRHLEIKVMNGLSDKINHIEALVVRHIEMHQDHNREGPQP
jgi:hypothetical protein